MTVLNPPQIRQSHIAAVRLVMPTSTSVMVLGVVLLLTNRGGGGPHWFPVSGLSWAFSQAARIMQFAGLKTAKINHNSFCQYPICFTAGAFDKPQVLLCHRRYFDRPQVLLVSRRCFCLIADALFGRTCFCVAAGAFILQHKTGILGGSG